MCISCVQIKRARLQQRDCGGRSIGAAAETPLAVAQVFTLYSFEPVSIMKITKVPDYLYVAAIKIYCCY